MNNVKFMNSSVNMLLYVVVCCDGLVSRSAFLVVRVVFRVAFSVYFVISVFVFGSFGMFGNELFCFFFVLMCVFVFVCVVLCV